MSDGMGKGVAMKRDGLEQAKKAWRRAGAVALLATAAMTLSACGSGTKEMLGLTKKAPDEFAVVPRAPLSMPPNFNLRPPQPGEPRPQEEAPSVAARKELFGSQAGAGVASGSGALGEDEGETLLLARVGADKADPNIRRVIEEESSALAQRDDSFIDDLIFWHDKEPAGTVVDAREGGTPYSGSAGHRCAHQ